MDAARKHPSALRILSASSPRRTSCNNIAGSVGKKCRRPLTAPADSFQQAASSREGFVCLFQKKNRELMIAGMQVGTDADCDNTNDRSASYVRIPTDRTVPGGDEPLGGASAQAAITPTTASASAWAARPRVTTRGFLKGAGAQFLAEKKGCWNKPRSSKKVLCFRWRSGMPREESFRRAAEPGPYLRDKRKALATAVGGGGWSRRRWR